MAPSNRDVQSMVVALFTLIQGLDRATREGKGASTLSLLQVVTDQEPMRPSEIADIRRVHPSLVTRQIRDLEDMGFVQVGADPADRRACLVTLTPAGAAERDRLQQVGLDRFALFVNDWETAEVRTLTALLDKLENSKSAAAARPKRPAGRRWARPAVPTPNAAGG